MQPIATDYAHLQNAYITLEELLAASSALGAAMQLLANAPPTRSLASAATLGSVSRTFNFVQVDVFTDRIFGGNQLAVFFDLEPGALSDTEMQAIALEMNLAETTFVCAGFRGSAAAAVVTHT